MDILLLRFDAPLMSFGAPIVDARGVIQQYPALSMLTGLLGNALGYDHRDTDCLQRLQERLRYACRQDRPGTRLRDFQTVDLNQEFLRDDRAWTTRDELEQRGGGAASSWRKGKGPPHIRRRDYWADAIHTVALSLEPPGEAPSADQVEAALKSPERPLFIGRKPCLPAAPLLLGRVQAGGLLDALRRHAPLPKGEQDGPRTAWWPSGPDEDEEQAMQLPVTDARDWVNQIHVGDRWIATGRITVTNQEHDDA